MCGSRIQDRSPAPLCGRQLSTRAYSSSLRLVSIYHSTRLMKIVRGFLDRNGKGATTGWIESIHLCTLLLIATHSYPSSPLPCSQVTVWFRRRTPHKVRTATRRPMVSVVCIVHLTIILLYDDYDDDDNDDDDDSSCPHAWQSSCLLVRSHFGLCNTCTLNMVQAVCLLWSYT